MHILPYMTGREFLEMVGIESPDSAGVPSFADMRWLLLALWKACRQYHRTSLTTRSPAFSDSRFS